MKCLVSGATGFVGRELCRQLQARGDTVVALSKSGASLADGLPTHAVDLAQGMPAARLLAGVETVFHLAGIAHQHAPPLAYRELNELATLQLARLAAAAGVRKFVFLSSVKAMGPGQGERERVEQDCAPPADPYGWSKWSAENALCAEFAGSAMSVVILRPALVYGPGARGNLALLARAVRSGLPRPPPLGGRSMVALADLVDLLCRVADQPQAGVRTWIVTDGRTYSTREIYDELRAALGRGAGRAWLPVAGWRAAAGLLDLLRRRGGESSFNKWFGSELYSNRAVREDTGWQPRLSFRDVAAALVAPGSGRT